MTSACIVRKPTQRMPDLWSDLEPPRGGKIENRTAGLKFRKRQSNAEFFHFALHTTLTTQIFSLRGMRAVLSPRQRHAAFTRRAEHAKNQADMTEPLAGLFSFRPLARPGRAHVNHHNEHHMQG